MRCEAFESRLHQLLDRRQLPEMDDQLRAHALGCRGCSRMLDAQEMLFSGLELFETPTSQVASDVLVRDLLQAEGARDKSPAKRSRWIGPLLLLAASIAMVLSIPWLVGPGDSTRQMDIAVQPPSPASPTTSIEAFEPFDSAQYFDDLASALPNQLPTVDQLSQIDSPVVRKGLKPLASSFNSAIIVIRRTIPGGRSTPPDSPQAFALPTLASHV